ncbi:MAG: hypothetical protein ACLVJO_07200 [[Clostridium] scindens]
MQRSRGAGRTGLPVIAHTADDDPECPEDTGTYRGWIAEEGTHEELLKKK